MTLLIYWSITGFVYEVGGQMTNDRSFRCIFFLKCQDTFCEDEMMMMLMQKGGGEYIFVSPPPFFSLLPLPPSLHFYENAPPTDAGGGESYLADDCPIIVTPSSASAFSSPNN